MSKFVRVNLPPISPGLTRRAALVGGSSVALTTLTGFFSCNPPPPVFPRALSCSEISFGEESASLWRLDRQTRNDGRVEIRLDLVLSDLGGLSHEGVEGLDFAEDADVSVGIVLEQSIDTDAISLLVEIDGDYDAFDLSFALRCEAERPEVLNYLVRVPEVDVFGAPDQVEWIETA